MTKHPLIVIISEANVVTVEKVVRDHSMEDYNRIGFNQLLWRSETHQVQAMRALSQLQARGFK